MPSESFSFGLRIRRKVFTFFLSIIFIFLSLMIIFNGIWLFSAREKAETRLLKQGYNDLMFLFNAKAALLNALAKNYAHGKKSDESDFLIILDKDGNVAGGDFGVLESDEYKGILKKASDKYRKEKKSFSGLVSGTGNKIWLISFSFVFGDGGVVLGVLCDDKFFKELGRDTNRSIEYFDLSANSQDLKKDFIKPVLKHLIGLQEPYLIGKERLGSFTEIFHYDFLLRDINGDVIELIRIRNPVGNYPLENRLLFLFLALSAFVFLACLLLIVNFFTKNISSPLVRLRDLVREIAVHKNLSKRLEVLSDDEAGELALEFNNMLEELEKMTSKMKNSGEEFAVLYRDLLDQKRFTSEVLATAPSIVLVLLPDGRVKFVNEAIEAVAGYKSEEMIGRDWFEYFLSFDKRPKVKAIFDEIIKGNIEPYRQFENEILSKDGKSKNILWNNGVLRDKDGNINSIIAIGQDISGIKKIEFELLKKINDLERFYRITMDREKMIIKLKNEVKQLKKQFEEIKG